VRVPGGILRVGGFCLICWGWGVKIFDFYCDWGCGMFRSQLVSHWRAVFSFNVFLCLWLQGWELIPGDRMPAKIR
jgi:hypothetical protein